MRTILRLLAAAQLRLTPLTLLMADKPSCQNASFTSLFTREKANASPYVSSGARLMADPRVVRKSSASCNKAPNRLSPNPRCLAESIPGQDSVAQVGDVPEQQLEAS